MILKNAEAGEKQRIMNKYENIVVKRIKQYVVSQCHLIFLSYDDKNDIYKYIMQLLLMLLGINWHLLQ